MVRACFRALQVKRPHLRFPARSGRARKSLQRPYSGPHKVINRVTDPTHEIEVKAKNKVVSIENINLALFLQEEQSEINLYVKKQTDHLTKKIKNNMLTKIKNLATIIISRKSHKRVER